RRSLSSVKPTIEGVVRLPSRLERTCGVDPSTTATQQLVVPRSMPRILLNGFPSGLALLLLLWRARATFSGRPNRNFDPGRSDEAVFQNVALAQLFENGVGRHFVGLLGRDGLVNVGIEGAADVHLLKSVPPQKVHELAPDEADALPEVALALLGRGVGHGSFEIIDNREKVPSEIRQHVLEVLALLPFGALAHVVELGELSRMPVLELFQVAHDGAEFLFRRTDRGAFFLRESVLECLARVLDLDVVHGPRGDSVAVIRIGHSRFSSDDFPSRRSRRSESARPRSSTTGMTRWYSRRAGPMTPNIPVSVSPVP